MGARVAIAMAVYNDGKYLARALSALEMSEWRDFSITIVDDGSTDDSVEVAERFAATLALTVHRAEHRGIYETKRDALSRVDPSAPFVMTLDSDIVLPPHALGAMVALLERNTDVAVVSARALSAPDSRLRRGLRFVEQMFYDANTDGADATWIVGGCALYRRAALETASVRTDMGEDAGFAEQLRGAWRLLCPRDLEADHLGVPASLGQVLGRGARDGARVSAMHRSGGATVQLGSLARLVPLPLTALCVGGALLGRPLIAWGAGLGLSLYLGAFVVASRKVAAPLPDRVAGALLFTWGNLGFGYGYARQRLVSGRRGAPLRDGARAADQ